MIRMIIIAVILTMIVIVTGEVEESKNVKKNNIFTSNHNGNTYKQTPSPPVKF